MFFKKALGAVLLSAALVSTAFSAETESDRVYIIGCDVAFAPFSWKEDEKYIGIDVEVLDAVAKAGNFNYELRPMNFDAIIPGIVSDQLDGGIAGININDQRQQMLDFSEPYFATGLSVIVKEDSSYNSLEDLRGKRAAIKKGTTGSVFVEENKEKFNFTPVYFNSSPETMEAVKSGAADFMMEDYSVIAYQIKRGEQKGLRIAIARVNGSPDYGFAVKKNANKELREKFNKGLMKIKEDGTYDKIVDKYL